MANGKIFDLIKKGAGLMALASGNPAGLSMLVSSAPKADPDPAVGLVQGDGAPLQPVRDEPDEIIREQEVKRAAGVF